MNFNELLHRSLLACISITLLGMPIRPAMATIVYDKSGPFFSPLPALPGLPAPRNVPGKEYSHVPDENTTGLPGNMEDPAQIIRWDGKGGTADGFDYSSTAPPFITSSNFYVDAIAATHDALFHETMADNAHLIFSISNYANGYNAEEAGLLALPVDGPFITPDAINGGVNTIGAAGELTFERGRFAGLFPANAQGVWANRATINGMPLPRDVDGIELWGGEPDQSPGDADKYSISLDILAGGIIFPGPFAVVNRTPATGYVLHSMVVDLVTDLLGIKNIVQPWEVNLDALMVMDRAGSDPNVFEAGDLILFSIRQIFDDDAPDGSRFMATGSEIFWLDGASAPDALVGGFLYHGGHLWDKKYALENMTTILQIASGEALVQLDINALEAVAGVPEPAGVTLLLIGLALALSSRRQTARRSRRSNGASNRGYGELPETSVNSASGSR